MELTNITQVVIFFIFVLALMAFSLSPAIYISEKLALKSTFVEKHSTKFSIIFSIFFATLATIFIFKF
ncbi:putative membrane protein [Aliarcobacter faecis]|uniref:hypothetical protein n=1 Tax=Aliarcobacter faecis TaxID=1564138 RepID=UPI00047ECE93|nr:hypothetical protein [Aliarcobacter faecis]QKF73347.1 putative membrane protein [Aliarcobacter faecis]